MCSHEAQFDRSEILQEVLRTKQKKYYQNLAHLCEYATGPFQFIIVDNVFT